VVVIIPPSFDLNFLNHGGHVSTVILLNFEIVVVNFPPSF